MTPLQIGILYHGKCYEEVFTGVFLGYAHDKQLDTYMMVFCQDPKDEVCPNIYIAVWGYPLWDFKVCKDLTAEQFMKSDPFENHPITTYVP